VACIIAWMYIDQIEITTGSFYLDVTHKALLQFFSLKIAKKLTPSVYPVCQRQR